MAYQAIVTKFLGPTNVRGSRVKATCDADSLTVNWDHSLGIEDNHRKAAEALQHKLGWDTEFYGALHMGGLPGSGYAFVFEDKPNPKRVRNPRKPASAWKSYSPIS